MNNTSTREEVEEILLSSVFMFLTPFATLVLIKMFF